MPDRTAGYGDETIFTIPNHSCACYTGVFPLWYVKKDPIVRSDAQSTGSVDQEGRVSLSSRHTVCVAHRLARDPTLGRLGVFCIVSC